MLWYALVRGCFNGCSLQFLQFLLWKQARGSQDALALDQANAQVTLVVLFHGVLGATVNDNLVEICSGISLIMAAVVAHDWFHSSHGVSLWWKKWDAKRWLCCWCCCFSVTEVVLLRFKDMQRSRTQEDTSPNSSMVQPRSSWLASSLGCEISHSSMQGKGCFHRKRYCFHNSSVNLLFRIWFPAGRSKQWKTRWLPTPMEIKIQCNIPRIIWIHY